MDEKSRLRQTPVTALTVEEVIELQLRLAELEEENQKLKEEKQAIAEDFQELAQDTLELAAINQRLAEDKERAEQEKDAAIEESGRDVLTGTYNRRGLLQIMERLRPRKRHIEHRRDEFRGKQCVLFLDMDRFKEINDSIGHFYGDQALENAAEYLTATLCRRETDHLGRWAGDEWLVIIEDGTASATRERLPRASDGYMQLGFMIRFKLGQGGELPYPITFSGGLSDVLPDEDFLIAMARADEMLYRAKKEGGNRVYKATPREDDAVRLAPTVARLRESIAKEKGWSVENPSST